MTRFFSEYEIKKFDKKLNEDLLVNGEKFKDDLKDAIDKDNHRSNVDRAKKKAVSQYMDYDGFHQMVLGADLKGMKLSDVTQIEPEKAIMNPLSEKPGTTNDMFYRNFVVDSDEKKIKFYVDDELTIQKFKIKWKEFKNTEDKINFVFDNFTLDKYKKLFDTNTLDADIFSDMIYQCGIALNDLQMNEEKKKFVIQMIDVIVNAAYFKKMKMFLGKKHKEPYTKMESSPETENIINKIIK